MFYVDDPADIIVFLTNKITDHDNHQDHQDIEDDSYSGTSQRNPTKDDIMYQRDDHEEGIWINHSFCVNKTHKSLDPTKKRKI